MAGKVQNFEQLTESHEINVTPFIDVVLVLLIIFMVAAPLATVNMPVDLPSSQADPVQQVEEPLFLTLSEDLELWVGEHQVARDALPEALAAAGGEPEQHIYLRADRGVGYGEVISLIDHLRTAGYSKIALVAQEGSE